MQIYTLAQAVRAALDTPWSDAAAADYAAYQYMLGAALAHNAPTWYRTRRAEFCARAGVAARIARRFPQATAQQAADVGNAALASSHGFARMVATSGRVAA